MTYPEFQTDDRLWLMCLSAAQEYENLPEMGIMERMDAMERISNARKRFQWMLEEGEDPWGRLEFHESYCKKANIPRSRPNMAWFLDGFVDEPDNFSMREYIGSENSRTWIEEK